MSGWSREAEGGGQERLRVESERRKGGRELSVAGVPGQERVRRRSWWARGAGGQRTQDAAELGLR